MNRDREDLATGGNPMELGTWWRSSHGRRLLLLAAAGLMGIALILAGNWLSPGPPASVTPNRGGSQEMIPANDPTLVEANDSSLSGLEALLSKRLEEVLSNISGAGHVRVLVTLSAGTEQLFAHDVTEGVRNSTESDGQGGRRTNEEVNTERRLTLLDSGSGGGRVPVVSQVKAASVRGVLVVAEGADDPKVRLRLVRAVQSLLDVPVHRIEVLQGKGAN